MIDAISKGKELGDAITRPLFFVRWEDYFNVSIEEIRQELNMTGAPEKGRWDWTLEHMRG
jgi:ubiquinone biosynthesis protein Coq4